MKSPSSTLLLVVVAMTNAQSQVTFKEPQRAQIEARLHLAAVKNPDRKEAIEKLFKEVGCESKLSEQPVKGGTKLPNVICTLQGESDQQIIVGGHYDKVQEGRGVVDNWSGSSLLPTIYESLNGQPRKHTLVFIAFASEEEGELGSKSYVKQLNKEQLAKISAMVNMDTLGLGPSEVWVSHADETLVKKIAAVAKGMNLPVSAMNVENVGSTDSEQFRDKKVPAITVHSVTTKTWPILHSNRDDFSAVQMDDYFQSCRLIIGYVSYLDATLDKKPDGDKKPEGRPASAPLLH